MPAFNSLRPLRPLRPLRFFFRRKIMNNSFLLRFALVLAFAMFAGGIPATAQMPPGDPISYSKMLSISITNPVDISRSAEPVVIPMTVILQKAPDFNRNFFRIKRQAGEGFEPLDIPSQIRRIPGAGYDEELVFIVDLGSRERKVVELQYNPSGTNIPNYPARTQAFEKWYTGGVNVAWENEQIAYRSYGGLLDFFAKSFDHLRLHDLPADSYHHEATWGVDPFVIGKKPGLCGVALMEGNELVPYYGGRDSLLFTHRAFGGGPVCAGAVVKVLNRGEMILEETYTLYTGHHENLVRAAPVRKGATVAAGMQKNDGETVRLDEKQGYLVSQARAGEYGTIGEALVFNPADFAGEVQTAEGRFIKLKTGADGSVRYLSLGAWYRVSDGQPQNMDALVKHAQYLAQCFRNPLLVEITK